MGTVAILHIKRAENKSGNGKNGIGTQSVSNHPSGENTGDNVQETQGQSSPSHSTFCFYRGRIGLIGPIGPIGLLISRIRRISRISRISL